MPKSEGPPKQKRQQQPEPSRRQQRHERQQQRRQRQRRPPPPSPNESQSSSLLRVPEPSPEPEVLSPSPSPSPTTASPSERFERLTGEIAAKAPEAEVPPGEPSPAAGAEPEHVPLFTPESFKEALQGAVGMLAFAQSLRADGGIPPEVIEEMFPERLMDRLALRGVPLANKYELKAGEWLVFWNRWRDEILFLCLDVPAVTFHVVRTYKAWEVAEAAKKKSDEGMETRSGAEPAS